MNQLIIGVATVLFLFQVPWIQCQSSPCDSGPCENGAVCEVTPTGGFQCYCVDGYTGERCSVNFDECASAPCRHRGQCTDEVAGYTCTCPPEYTGQDCEINVDDCVPGACEHNGTCIDLIGGYICLCPPPYKGDNCSTLPCDVSVCENGATCVNDVTFNVSTTGYLCQCPAGYTGTRCESSQQDCDVSACSGNGLCVDGDGTFTCFCQPGWIGQFCQQPVDDCQDNSCKNNATCTDIHLGYECACAAGYEGALCERERDECGAWMPCQNGATCVDLFNGYRCECSAGWIGANCTETVTQCEDSSCLNGGQCLEVPGGFQCRCPPFFTGTLCETNYNPCSPEYNPCENGANCITPPDGQYRCYCAKGFTGVNCEVNINECLSLPCENNATCEDITSGYKCHCSPGWEGDNCENNIDDCASRPCLNNATCSDLHIGFECNCTSAYEGRQCQDVVDFCLQQPCSNGATCISELGGYQCACPYPFTGDTCLDLIDSCASDPCLNNGTCSNTREGFQCTCVLPHTGVTCERLTNFCVSEPCFNGGTCTSLKSGFVCSCPPFLTGRQCTELADYCEDEPCRNDGFCINGQYNFRCICAYGFTGATCDVMIDFCVDTPCQNAANCTNIPGGFFCACPPYYTGELCQSELPSVIISPTSFPSSSVSHFPYDSNIIQTSAFPTGNTSFSSSFTLNTIFTNTSMPRSLVSLTTDTSTIDSDTGYNITSTKSNHINYTTLYSTSMPYITSSTTFQTIQSLSPSLITTISSSKLRATFTLSENSSPVASFTVLAPSFLSLSMTSSLTGYSKTLGVLSHDQTVTSPLYHSPSTTVSETLKKPYTQATGLSLTTSLLSSESSLFHTSRLSMDRSPRRTRILASRTFSVQSSLISVLSTDNHLPSSTYQNLESSYGFPSYDSKKLITPLETLSGINLETTTSTTIPDKTGSLESLESSNVSAEGNVLSKVSPTLSTSIALSHVIVSSTPIWNTMFSNTAATALLTNSVSTRLRSAHAVVHSSTDEMNNYTVIVSTSQGVVGHSTMPSSTELATQDKLFSISTEQLLSMDLTPVFSITPVSDAEGMSISTTQKSKNAFSSPIPVFTDVSFSGSTTDISSAKDLTTTENVKVSSSLPLTLSFSNIASRQSESSDFESSIFEPATTNEESRLRSSYSKFPSSYFTGVSASLTESSSESLNVPYSNTEFVHTQTTTVTVPHDSSTVIESLLYNTTEMFPNTRTSTSTTELSSTQSKTYWSSMIKSISFEISSSEQDGLNTTETLLELTSLYTQIRETISTLDPISDIELKSTSSLTFVTSKPELTSTYSTISSIQNARSSLDFTTSTLAGKSVSSGPTPSTQTTVPTIPTPRASLIQTAPTADSIPTLVEADFSTVILPTPSSTKSPIITRSPTVTHAMDTSRNASQESSNILERTSSHISPVTHSSEQVDSSTMLKSSEQSYWSSDGSSSRTEETTSLSSTPFLETSAITSVMSTSTITSTVTTPEPSISTTTGEPTSACGSSICLNRGVCRQDAMGSFCDCPDNYIGASCETVSTACDGYICENGGRCRVTWGQFGVHIPKCDCPLPFSGTRCDIEQLIYFPSFTGTSYIQLPAPAISAGQMNEIFITLKTTHTSGTILYASSRTNQPWLDGSSSSGNEALPLALHGANTTRGGDDSITYDVDNNNGKQQVSLAMGAASVDEAVAYVWLFMVDGRLQYKFSCDGMVEETIDTSVNIASGDLHEVLIRQTWTSGVGQWCSAAVSVNGRAFMANPVLTTGNMRSLHSLYIGGYPRFTSGSSVHVLDGLVGCVRNLQMNDQELDLVSMATASRNIDNCNVPACSHNPCKNGATCHSSGEEWYCNCPSGFGGTLCERKLCDVSTCHHGGTCVILDDVNDQLCICPYGAAGVLCENEVHIDVPHFHGNKHGYSSYLAYDRPHFMVDDFELELHFIQDVQQNSSLLLFIGNTGSASGRGDFVAIGVELNYVVFRFDLGSGFGQLFSASRLDAGVSRHVVRCGRTGNSGWLQVDAQRNVTGRSRGQLTALNTNTRLYVGGVDTSTVGLLPNGASFDDGFKGCIFNVQIKSQYSEFVTPGNPPGHVTEGRNVIGCLSASCDQTPCTNGGTCQDVGASIFCSCPSDRHGVYCMETITVCDGAHACAAGSTCKPALPSGYQCMCPLGRQGQFCEQELEISDPLFNGEDSFMSFHPVFVKREIHIVLQVKPARMTGLMFYASQHQHVIAGDFLALSLYRGVVELRFHLGDKLNTVRSEDELASDTWYTIKAGRNSTHAYLAVESRTLVVMVTGMMSYLDVTSDFFLGGVPSLEEVSQSAFYNEPTAFKGCIRELTVNGHKYELTVQGDKDGRNVADCDGTRCGYDVCKHNGTCKTRDNGTAYDCTCSDNYYGDRCEEPVQCRDHSCVHGECAAQADDYMCYCNLGWSGRYCDIETAVGTSVRLPSDSFLLISAKDTHFNNQTTTRLSFDFKTPNTDGLIMWAGQSHTDDSDYLGVGVNQGKVTLVWNLGWFSRGDIITSLRYNDGFWHAVDILRFDQTLTMTIDGTVYESRVSGDFHHLDIDGHLYIGGFHEGDVNQNTFGYFSDSFNGCLRNLKFNGSPPVQFDDVNDGRNVVPCG